MSDAYKVHEEICGCHYSIRLVGSNEVVISSWFFTDKSQADLFCDELNRAWENGHNDKIELQKAAEKIAWNINNVSPWIERAHALWCNYQDGKNEKCNCGVTDLIRAAKEMKESGEKENA